MELFREMTKLTFDNLNNNSSNDGNINNNNRDDGNESKNKEDNDFSLSIVHISPSTGRLMADANSSSSGQKTVSRTST
jgi:hypothetical protein